MEWMRSWVMSIAGTVVFGAVCEILLPDGNMKKYIRIVLGMLLVFTVAKPLTAVNGIHAPDLDLPVQKSQAYTVHAEMEELQRGQVMDLYSANLQEKIKKSAEQTYGSGGRVSDIQLKISDKKQSFGEIQALSVNIISSNKGKNNLSEQTKKHLAKEFNLSEDDVKIYVTLDKGGV